MDNSSSSLKQCKVCERHLSKNDINFRRNKNGNHTSPCRKCIRDADRETKRRKRSRSQQKGQEYVKCEICCDLFVQITNSHTQSAHGITLAEYKEKFPKCEISSDNLKKYAGERSKRMWEENYEELHEIYKEVGKKYRGKNSPNWKGGYEAGVTGGSPKSKARRRAIREYGHKCMIPNCDFSFVVHNHHIIPRAKNGSHDLSNCIILCPNHHAMADAGIIPQEFLKSIVDAFSDLE